MVGLAIALEVRPVAKPRVLGGDGEQRRGEVGALHELRRQASTGPTQALLSSDRTRLKDDDRRNDDSCQHVSSTHTPSSCDGERLQRLVVTFDDLVSAWRMRRGRLSFLMIE